MSDIATDDLSIPPFLDRTGAAAESVSEPPLNWRDHIKVHPAADLFPMMSEAELDELAKDIAKRGDLLHNIVLYKGELLDGRNRLAALDRLGTVMNCLDGIDRAKHLDVSIDPYEYVLSVNINRRHLSEEQRREVIAKLIKAKPEASDRAIANAVKRDHKVVARVRKKMERTGAVAPVERRVGADGKRRKKPKQVETDQERRDREECVALFEKTKAADPEFAEWLSGPKQQRATGSAEVGIEERRAQNAALDEPAEVDEVEKRVNCLTNTILGHVKGLSRSDALRFIAALRDRLDDTEREVIVGGSRA